MSVLLRKRQREAVDVTVSVWKVSLIFRKVRWQFDGGWEDMEESPDWCWLPTKGFYHIQIALYPLFLFRFFSLLLAKCLGSAHQTCALMCAILLVTGHLSLNCLSYSVQSTISSRTCSTNATAGTPQWVMKQRFVAVCKPDLMCESKKGRVQN